MQIPVRLGEHSYPITIARGILQDAGSYIPLDRKVFVLTDRGVPRQYPAIVMAQGKEPYGLRMPEGEGSKSIPYFANLHSFLLEKGFSRKDCIVAVGGGVVCDLAGFLAATYMRGIDFYTVPTTLLSQVDASVGGKTAINLDGVKNVIGAFYQPKAVLIDPDTLDTLPPRQLSNGMAEAVKMALTSDAALFERFERNDPFTDLDEIIARAVTIKRDVVEQDEHEADLRRILNFGHTIGHGIESAAKGALYHGESVALGMLPMCSPAVRERLIPVLQKLHLPTETVLDPAAVYAALTHDKKANADRVSVVRVEEVGSYRIETVPVESLKPLIATVVKGENV